MTLGCHHPIQGRGLGSLRPLPTPEEALEELEFAESELDRALHRATELERMNERLSQENRKLLQDIEEIKAGHFELANTNELLSSRLLAAQCRIARLEARATRAEAKSADREHESEMAMARELIGGLRKECANYEQRVVELKRQLSRMAAAIHAERARR